MLTAETLAHAEALNAMAADRGQSLAQMALAWALRDPRVTSSLIGASSVEQLDENLAALDNLEFTDDELADDRPARRRRRHQPLVVVQRALKWYGGPYLRSGATSVASCLGAQEDPPMQSHAERIQTILARELDTHRRQVALVQASLLTVPPRSSGISAGARAQDVRR